MHSRIIMVVLLGVSLSVGAGYAAALEGYDDAKLNNPNHRTPKYLFGRVAMRHELDGVKSHADAEALLRSMVPEMRAAGLIIGGVRRDKILVKTEIGWEWVDVVARAGGDNPGWWWGSEGVPTTDLPADLDDAAGPEPAARVPPPATGGRVGGPLSTVPDKPEFAAATIDTSNDEKAIISAATWVKQTYPQFFVEGDDRDKQYQMMTAVIGALRAKGYDVHRCVNHPSRPIGNPWRYGSDSLVLKGRIYDCYAGIGDLTQSRPQALYCGPYAAGRPRE